MESEKAFRIKMQGSPDLQIGKAGVNEAVINQAVLLLKRLGLLKVRVLRNTPEDLSLDEIVHGLTEATESQLGSIRGRCFVLYKESWRSRLHVALPATRSKSKSNSSNKR